MSDKLLNRNVNTAFNVLASHHKPKEDMKKIDNNKIFEDFLGTYENSNNRLFSKKDFGDKISDSDIESIILDLNKLGGLSSSSSLSWSDDYETETTKKVFDELKKLDNVLKGEEPIPSNYDREECEEWMHRFPYLSIFDEKTPTNSVENLLWNRNSNQIADTHYECDSDKKSIVMNASSPAMIKPYRGFSTIDQTGLFKGQKRCINNNVFFASKPKSLDVDQYLKVSPVLHSKRKQSSKSLLNRQISRDSPDNPDYCSLPCIKIESLPSLKLQKSSQQIRKKSTYSKTGRNDNQLILPPIDIEQFRSISAIPKENFKTLSALSVNLNNKQKLQKKKHSSDPLNNVLTCKRPRNIF